MASLVFKLRHVPDDEAAAVRTLLETQRVEYYETTAGNWGIAMPGLWVDDADVAKARAAIDQYQAERSKQHRQQLQDAASSGEPTVWYSYIVKRPLATIGIVLFCAFILYALLSPFIRLALA